MSTQTSGRLGGQYKVDLVTDDRYRVQGFLHNSWHTIWTGDYEFATKLLSFCTSHDGTTQTAMQALFFEGDPTRMMELIENARLDVDAKPRKRVAMVAFIETDILESENAITLVSQRISAALALSGLNVTQLNVHYQSELVPEVLRDRLDEIDTELNDRTEIHNLRIDGAFDSRRKFEDDPPPDQEPAVQTGAPLVSDPSDRENVVQSPMTRPNK